MRCFTNFFSKKCICSVLVILGVLVGIDIYYKLDLVGWFSAVWTMFSAVWTMFSALGLIWFSSLTYKNQQRNEFYSLFELILDENNRLLKEIIESNKNSVPILNKNIIDLFKNICLRDECNLRNKAQFEINFQKEVVKEIDLHHELKPYLITLFRLLKLISTSNKIRDNDKKEYYGLIRGLTPPHIQFLILFNSLGYREKEKNYTDLLIESKFFEHLPITESWLTEVYSFDQKVERENRNPLKEEEVKMKEEEVKMKEEEVKMKEEEVKNLTLLLEEYIFSRKVINLKAFGESIYLKQAVARIKPVR